MDRVEAVSGTTMLWAGITAGFGGAMWRAWRVCQPTKDEQAEMLRHLQHMDAIKFSADRKEEI